MGPRKAYDTKLHGKPLKCWDFYPVQTVTALALNKLMVGAIKTYSADVCTVPGVVDINKVKGAIGHYNITEEKLDPGTKLMQDLAHYMKTGELPPGFTT